MFATIIQPLRRKTPWMILLCLSVLALLLAACGGGDSGSSGSSQSNTASSSQSNSGSSSSNAQSSGSSSKMTVSIKESKGSSGDVYTFDPATITLHKGDSITIQNESDENQDIDKGDASKAGVDVMVPINQSGTATFNTPGTFTLVSEKGAKITVTVQ